MLRGVPHPVDLPLIRKRNNISAFFLLLVALQEDGFGENPFFRSIVVETNSSNTTKDTSSKEDSVEKKIIGYALYYFGYSSYHGKLVFLEDVYVSPEHRGKW